MKILHIINDLGSGGTEKNLIIRISIGNAFKIFAVKIVFNPLDCIHMIQYTCDQSNWIFILCTQNKNRALIDLWRFQFIV